MYNWLVKIYTFISENSILASIVASILLMIILWASGLPVRIINEFSEYSGIYEGNAEDLICDNAKPESEMLYIIRAKMNNYLFYYKFIAHVNMYDRSTIYDRSTKGFLGTAVLKGKFKEIDNMGYMEYSFTSSYKSEPREITNYGFMIFSIRGKLKLHGIWITAPPRKNQNCNIASGSISLLKTGEASSLLSSQQLEGPRDRIEETRLMDSQDPSGDWREISVDEYLHIKNKEDFSIPKRESNE